MGKKNKIVEAEIVRLNKEVADLRQKLQRRVDAREVLRIQLLGTCTHEEMIFHKTKHYLFSSKKAICVEYNYLCPICGAQNKISVPYGSAQELPEAKKVTTEEFNQALLDLL